MDQKHKLRNDLKSGLTNDDLVSFFHFVKFDLSGNLSRGQFVRNASYYKENKNIKDIWIEGLLNIYCFYGEKLSLIEKIFNSVSIKYSFHVNTSISSSNLKEQCKIRVYITNRDIFIDAVFPKKSCEIFNVSISSDNNHSEGLFEEYIDSIWQLIQEHNDIDYNESKRIIKQFKKLAAVEINKYIKDSNLAINIIDVVESLLCFLFPTNENPEKRYSVFVNPSYSIAGCEVTSGGLAAFFCGDKMDHAILLSKIKGISDKVSLWASYETIEDLLQKSEANMLRLAITSILIDSYSHNISAHSLSALQWWFRERSEKSFEQKIWLGGFPRITGLALNELDREQLQQINRRQMSHLATNGSGFNIDYYEALGLDDHTNTIDYTSLIDYLRFLPARVAKREFDDNLNFIPYTRSNKVKERASDPDELNYLPRLPMPLDFALHPFLRYLKEKGAFWSGVLRDNAATPGQHINLYDLLFEEFINNPLFLGTIAHSEGINKIRFYLHLEDKSRAGKFEEDTEGAHFATVDLSLIQKPANKQVPLPRAYDFAEEPSPGSFETQNEKGSDTAHIPWSDLAFVRLGPDFEALRSVMQDPANNYKIFLPGNVTGKHALLTILENTLRNIKHYGHIPNLVRDGISFHISVRREYLFDQHTKRKKENPKRPAGLPELWRFGIWLGHELKTRHYSREELEEVWREVGVPQNVEKSLLNELTLLAEMYLRTIQSVVDAQGRARLGGNSQDKVCAASLLRHNFSKVENDDQDPSKRLLQRYYYPWLRFATYHESVLMFPSEGELVESDEKVAEAYRQNLEAWERRNILHWLHESSNKSGGFKSSGFLKKYFFLWRGDELGDMRGALTDNDRLSRLRREADNLSRYRLLIVDQPEAFTTYRQMGVVRILRAEQLSQTSGSDFYKAYCDWLSFWCRDKATDFEFARIVQDINGKDNPQVKAGLAFRKGRLEHTDGHISGSNTILLAHGGHGARTEGVCDIRSHGALLQYLLEDRTAGKEIDKAFEKQNSTIAGRTRLLEIFETLATRIAVIDDRIFNKIERYHSGKRTKILRQLNLQVYQEAFQKDGEIRVMDVTTAKNSSEGLPAWWIEKGQKQFHDIDRRLHILIIHLSFIEKLGYSEKSVNQFISERILNCKAHPTAELADNFLFGITTGRGRTEWWDTIKSDSKLRDKVIFIPIESLESAVESAIIYGDDFQLKYNICKTVFGS